MTSTAHGSVQLAAFTRRQTELNRFLWTTELAYGIVKQDKLLREAPQDAPAWEVLRHVRSEAWTPTAKSRRAGAPAGKYSGSVGAMRRQIESNMSTVLWSVLALFIAEFETYVEHRFAGWFAEKAGERNGPLTIPAPAALLASLQPYFAKSAAKAPVAPIDVGIVLRADLMKKVRNLYVHKGLDGIPRDAADPEIAAWVTQVTKGRSPYSAEQANEIVTQVIGGAIEANKSSGRPRARLGEEFFYALFTLTNIREFVVALDRSYPVDPAPPLVA
jgi:hypothetical protein